MSKSTTYIFPQITSIIVTFPNIAKFHRLRLADIDIDCKGNSILFSFQFDYEVRFIMFKHYNSFVNRDGDRQYQPEMAILQYSSSETHGELTIKWRVL